MDIGYACLNVTLQSKMRTCRLKTVQSEGMDLIKQLTLINFHQLKKIIQWNIENQISFFRVSSDIVPFGSHEILSWNWWEDKDVRKIADDIHQLQKKHQLRLSIHPGQYTIINSPNETVVKNAFRELEYHSKLLSLVGGTDMVIHVGGVYGDKETAKKRFIENYDKLSDEIKRTLIVENDDKSFHVQDVLHISRETGAPVCFDIHHHHCNPPQTPYELDLLVAQVFHTWKGIRKPKVHISSGKRSKLDTAHHDYILKEDFETLLSVLGDADVDIMFEAKAKEKAVLEIRGAK